MKLVILDCHAVNPGDLSWEPIKQLADCTIYERTRQEDVVERAKDADGILINKVNITEEVLQQLPKLKYIGELATGYNNIDIAAARARGVVVCNIPAYSTDSVAQHVFALLLNAATRVDHYAEAVRRGDWCKQQDFCYWDTPLIELAGKTLGIHAYGHIGKILGRLGKAFGMDVYGYTRSEANRTAMAEDGVKLVSSVEELYSKCQFVSTHIPANDATKKSLNYALLSKMPKGAVLVNTARKEIIDEDGLLKLMAEREDMRYVSDIQPDKLDEFNKFGDRVFFTPKKMGAQTAEANINAGLAAAEQIVKFIKNGDRTFQVNK